MNAVLEVSPDDFDSIVRQSELPVLLDFYAQWCGPCKAMAPAMDDLAREFGGEVVVAKIDIDTARDLATEFGVSAVPTFLVLKDGEVRHRIVGAQTRSKFAAILDDVAGAA